ncbi:hypothetical protein VNO78_08212 [Psophocarpus tetragonolobus]|uniref:Secreted protein n=1 Tax=Psophocarpus tetragonolobus TaxID=3891 RepID=A0AAN9XT60_PSOTE
MPQKAEAPNRDSSLFIVLLHSWSLSSASTLNLVGSAHCTEAPSFCCFCTQARHSRRRRPATLTSLSDIQFGNSSRFSSSCLRFILPFSM